MAELKKTRKSVVSVDTKTEVTPSVEVPQKAVKAEKTTKVQFTEDHPCCIGGKRYNFKKGEIVELTQSIYAVLSRGNFLRPV